MKALVSVSGKSFEMGELDDPQILNQLKAGSPVLGRDDRRME